MFTLKIQTPTPTEGDAFDQLADLLYDEQRSYAGTLGIMTALIEWAERTGASVEPRTTKKFGRYDSAAFGEVGAQLVVTHGDRVLTMNEDGVISVWTTDRPWTGCPLHGGRGLPLDCLESTKHTDDDLKWARERGQRDHDAAAALLV